MAGSDNEKMRPSGRFTPNVVRASAEDAWADAKSRTAGLLSGASRPRPEVLVIEDEPAVRRMVVAVLDALPKCQIASVRSGNEAIAFVEERPVDVMVVDKNLPDINGIETFRIAREKRATVDAVILTGYPNPESVGQAITARAERYMLKPLRDPASLREAVTDVLKHQALVRLFLSRRNEWRELAEDLHDLVLPGGAVRLGLSDIASVDVLARMRVAVLRDPEVAAELASGNLDVISLDSPVQLVTAPGDIDLVFFGAEGASDTPQELAYFARGRPRRPHLVPIGTFTLLETALASLAGRAACMMPRPLRLDDVQAELNDATLHRRLEVPVTALGSLVSAMGLSV